MKNLFSILLCLAALPVFAQDEDEMILLQGAMVASGGSAPTPDIFWWKLNEGSGTSITGDGTTGGDDGTTDATWADGGLDFNGSSQDAATSSNITSGTNIVTVTLWVNTDTGDNSTRMWVELSYSATVNVPGFLIYTDANGLNGYLSGTTGGRQETVAQPAAGTWFCYAFVFDNSTATGDVKIYKDGTELTPAAPSPNDKTGTSNFTVQPIYVGARNSSTFWFDGGLDDIRVYSGELNASQISAIYSAGRQ